MTTDTEVVGEVVGEVDLAVALAFATKKFVLQALLEKAASVVPSKDIMPVLKNYLVEAAPGRLRVVATDLELSVLAQTQLVEVTEPGSAIFPAKKLLDILRAAEDGQAQVTLRGNLAHLEIGPTTWDLRLADGTDYPEMPDLGAVTLAELDRGRFLAALSAVRYAAATDTVRPSLMMINIGKDGKATACDGVRFQQATIAGWPAELAGAPFDVQIPIGAVEDLVKLLRTTDLPTVGIGRSDHHLVFRLGEDYFVATKLLATFPNVEELLLRPALANKDVLTCDRGELLDAVRRVRINADPETSALVLDVGFASITVRTRDKFGNTASERIHAGWTKPARQLVVNHRYLTDMLAMSGAKTATFKLGEDGKSRKSYVMLADPDSGGVGLVNQMRADWVVG